MIAYFSILFYFILFFLLLKWGRVGPISLVASYSFVSLFVFFLNDRELIYFEPYKGLPLPMVGGYLYSTRVYLIGIIFCSMCLFGLLYYRKIKNGNGLSFYILALLKERHNPRFVFINYLFMVFFFFFYIWHMLEIDFSPIISNTAYLFNVDPVNVGAVSVVGRLTHNLTGPFGLIFAFMIAFYFKAKRYDMLVLVVLLFGYSVFIKSAQFSRWLPLMFACLAISVFMIYESRKKYIVILPFVVMTLFCFIIVLKGRGGFEQGFSGFVHQIALFSLVDLHYITNLVVNVFGGYVSYAESLEMNWSYDFGYIIRSFSPFPGFLDDWESYVGDVGRINRYVPYSLLSELHFFGGWVTFIAFVLFFISLMRIEYLHRQYSSVLSVLAFVIFVYVFLASYFYPIRNVFRIYLICLVMYELSAFYINRKKRRGVLNTKFS